MPSLIKYMVSTEMGGFRLIDRIYHTTEYITKGFLFRAERNEEHITYMCDLCRKSYRGGIMIKVDCHGDELGKYFHEKCFKKMWIKDYDFEEKKGSDE